jgi:hypothetical protein
MRQPAPTPDYGDMPGGSSSETPEFGPEPSGGEGSIPF